MDFVRKVIDAKDLNGLIEMPTSLINKRVEVLIFPVENIVKKKSKKKSLSGVLSKYANLSLIEKEANAWFEEAKE